MGTFSINDLEPQTFLEICRLLSAPQCAQIAVCQKLWRVIAADEGLWHDLCHRDYLMRQATTPEGVTRSTWKKAYASWHASFAGRYKPYAKRAIAAWQTIEDWTQANHENVFTSFGLPATEQQLDDAQKSLGCKIPDSLRVIYRLHDGQVLQCDETFPMMTPHASMFDGVLGGYSFYDHIVCTRLLPIRQAAISTKRLRNRNEYIDYGDGLNLTGSIQTPKNIMVMDHGCQVRVSSCEDDKSWDAAPPGGFDAALRWFEAYADTLKHRLACCNLHDQIASIGICLYPIKQPWLRVAVTNRVRVEAAAIFVPELSKQKGNGNEEEAYFFSYNVRFFLMSEEEQREVWSHDSEFVPLSRVQLQARHWIIRDHNGEITQNIKGDGVIGKHPILTPGGKPFVYQSCTAQQQPRGSMEGFFKFIEGTTKHPTGPDFDVECPLFRLDKPDYVF